MKVNDLEEKILGVWSTSDDIDLLLDWISDHVLIYDDAGEDELMNLLIGIKSLHHQRCHVLFRDFEKVLANERPPQTATYAPSGAPIRTAEGLLVDGKVPAPEWT